MPRKNLGTLVNSAGYATHYTHRIAARKVENKHPVSIPVPPKGKEKLENTKLVRTTFHSQSNLFSFKSDLRFKHTLGRIINCYPTRQKPILTTMD